jgi:hypothetical protein
MRYQYFLLKYYLKLKDIFVTLITIINTLILSNIMKFEIH